MAINSDYIMWRDLLIQEGSHAVMYTCQMPWVWAFLHISPWLSASLHLITNC